MAKVPKYLEETVGGMLSPSWRERFLAEYHQVKIRADRLHEMIACYEAGTLEFTPESPLKLLKKQEKAMRDYLYCLEVRGETEGVPVFPDCSEEEDIQDFEEVCSKEDSEDE